MTNGQYKRQKEWKAIKTGRVLVITWRDYPAYVVDSKLSAEDGLQAFLAEYQGAGLIALTASIDALVGAE